MRFWIVVLVLANAAAAMAAPTPSSMMERHLQARGGRAALEHMQVIERQGSFTYHAMAPEPRGTYHTCLQYPDRVVVDIKAAPIEIHQVLGDNGVFDCNASFTSCMPGDASLADELKSTAQQANREELSDSLPASQYELLDEKGAPIGYRFRKGDDVIETEFAPDTGLERRKKKGTRERRYADWQDAGGVLIPMQIEDYEAGRKQLTIVLSSAKLSSAPSEWCRARFAAKATPIEAVVAHPIFDQHYACSEHAAGELHGLGDELGTDCMVEQLVEKKGRTWLRAYRSDGLKNEDWFGYGANVLAPCSGTIAAIEENTVVNQPGVLGKPNASSIQIACADDVHFTLAHIADPLVAKGDRVAAGQKIAKVGNNGVSRQPHIHIGAWKGDVPLQIRFDQTRMRHDD